MIPRISTVFKLSGCVRDDLKSSAKLVYKTVSKNRDGQKMSCCSCTANI